MLQNFFPVIYNFTYNANTLTVVQYFLLSKPGDYHQSELWQGDLIL